MASVVGQMLQLDFGGRFQLDFFPNTQSPHGNESFAGRAVRHVKHVRRVRSRIRQARASLVHIHTCSGFSFYRSVLDMIAAQHLGARVVLHIHGAKFDQFHGGEPAWRRRLIGWALARADRVVALSTQWRKALGAMSLRARIVVIENAVDRPVTDVHPQDSARPCRFVLLARMDHWKGIHDLLDACTRLRDASTPLEVTLAGPPGSAGDAESLGDEIRKRRLASFVRYIGEVHGHAKADLLARADAYVQPSHNEGMPIALLEALAFGLPIVATRVGAVPEVIENGKHGRLVPPQRPDLLADALRELALDAPLRRRMSDEARRLATSRFGLDRFRNDLLAMYEDLFAASTGARCKSRHAVLPTTKATASAIPTPHPATERLPSTASVSS
jgi:glycosyltransferase involved in cell wall biosynthesis